MEQAVLDDHMNDCDRENGDEGEFVGRLGWVDGMFVQSCSDDTTAIEEKPILIETLSGAEDEDVVDSSRLGIEAAEIADGMNAAVDCTCEQVIANGEIEEIEIVDVEEI
jgi:hypothetical protein